MNFKELQNEYAKDCVMDKSDLVGEALKIPHLHNKYLKELYASKDLLIRTELELKGLKKKKWIYYNGKDTTEVYRDDPFNLKILKGDMPIFYDADQEMQEIVYRVSFIKQKIDFIERVVKEINARSFLINNVNKTRSFENGEN